MGWERTSTDDLQRLLVSAEEERSRLAAVQLELLEELDRRQVHTGDGCRTLGEWVGLVLDTTLEDARGLVRLMRRTADRPDLREALSTGTSFRRIEALSRIPGGCGFGSRLGCGGVASGGGPQGTVECNRGGAAG